MACCRSFLAAAVVAAVAAAEPSSLEDELAQTVLLQTAASLQQNRALSVTPPEPNAPPIEQLSKVGGNGQEAWPLWTVEMPGQIIESGLEITSPANTSDPIFLTCGGFQLPHGWPEDYYADHWTYNVAEPRLLPFIVPKDAPNRRDAAVVVTPGGGGRFINIDLEGRDIAAWLNSIGISAFVLVYRVSKVPSQGLSSAQLMDSQRAVSMVRSRAEALGFNASQIGIMGFSKGGELAAKVSVTSQREYSPTDAVDSVSFRPDFALLVYGAVSAQLPREVAQHVPPSFITLAQDDPCVGLGGAQFWRTLHANGGPKSELHAFDSGGHGYGACSRPFRSLTSSATPMCSWPRLAQKFIENVAVGMHWQGVLRDLAHWEKVDPRFVNELDAAQKARDAAQ